MASADEVLERTVDVLVAMGHSPRALAKRFAQACQSQEEPTRPADPRLASYITQLGNVLSYWSSDPVYVDRRGQARVLPFRGRNRSLTALIERVLPGENPRKAVDALLRARAVGRDGARYQLLRRFVSTAETFPLAHAQSLSSIRGLLHTVQHNVSCALPVQRLLERKAANLFIPVRLLPEVQQYLKHRVNAMLEEVDRYLSDREVKPGRELTTSVHLVTFVHEDPLMTGVRRARKRRVSRLAPRRSARDAVRKKP